MQWEYVSIICFDFCLKIFLRFWLLFCLSHLSWLMHISRICDRICMANYRINRECVPGFIFFIFSTHRRCKEKCFFLEWSFFGIWLIEPILSQWTDQIKQIRCKSTNQPEISIYPKKKFHSYSKLYTINTQYKFQFNIELKVIKRR